jgi:tryptophanyl-tRNA synthetase
MTEAQPRRSRVLSGMRPTGPLHLGHLVGALENWVAFQERYECLFCIVDWHALSTEYADTRAIGKHIREVAIDWLAAGLDPERCHMFVQSDVKEHAELHLLLSMIVPLPWLERVPTYKEQQRELKEKSLNTYGFLGYPLLQAADILVYRADLVPVGEDQVPHLELTREIARRFHQLYKNVFPEPQACLTPAARLPGTDGRKMSKSYGNAIYLGDSAAVVAKKLDGMLTDPQRTHRHIPGDPEVCPVFHAHKIFSPEETVAWAANGCRTAGIGCRDCKGALRENLLLRLAPIRERRTELESRPDEVDGILARGASYARTVAGRTMERVRRAMKVGR